LASRTEKIAEILRGLRVSSPDVIGAAVVSIEGFML
jgi:predicted regulator of Ras-like GTPase activity (Roadblock/LC7/MglB family)